MPIRTQQSLTGFIATDPQLTFTSNGDARFYARVGQEQFRRLDDGSFEKTGVEFTDLAQYRKAAERAYEQFRKGDSFVAEGYTRDFDHTLEDGSTEPRQEFVAKKLGHDTARTTYTVDRTHHTAAETDRDQGPERALAPFTPVASRAHVASSAASLAL